MSRLFTALACLLILTACSGSSPMTPTPLPTLSATPTPVSSPTPIPTLNNLIPKPVSVTVGVGAFTLTESTTISVAPTNPELQQVGQYLADKLNPATGYQLKVTAATAPAPNSIYLTTQGGDPTWGDEGYQLTVTPQSVTIIANQPAGAFYAVQTLRQLLPAAIESPKRQQADWLIQAATITDHPRFAWRGAMLDVARHFFSVADVKNYIDQLAAYKINRFHLHLSDDQGWRLVINSWPKLATVGGSTEVGGGAGGYYTQADYAEIVAYAQARYMTLIPEIDTPGHTNAALASYPELNCNGQAPALYTGTKVGFSSLCIDSETTYKFLDDVIGEIAALTPGPYIHIGGDEAQATSLPDYERFITRVQKIVQAHGKEMIGWEEISQADLPPGTLAQHWNGSLALQAELQGAQVIMSPASKAYLDMKYDASTPLGQDWAGLIDEATGYQWDPATQLAGLKEKDIIGVEAPLWTETIQTPADLEYMAFPRILGYAEIGWSPAANRSWAEYKSRLATFGPRLKAAGINFYQSKEVPWP